MELLIQLKQIDFELFQVVNSLAGKWEWLDALGIFSAEYLIYIIGALVVWIVVRQKLQKGAVKNLQAARNWFFPSGMPKKVEELPRSFDARWRFDAVTLGAAAASAGGGYLLRALLGNLVGRIRPFNRAFPVTHLSSNLTDASFPSGHATIAFALAFSVAFAYPAAGSWLLLLALLVALGRVYVGVHYPADVIAGMVLGLVSAVVASIIVRLIARRNNIALIAGH